MAEFSIIKALWRNTKSVFLVAGFTMGVIASITAAAFLLEYISTITSPIVGVSLFLLGTMVVLILGLTVIDWKQSRDKYW
jgi:hypothetical protein